MSIDLNQGLGGFLSCPFVTDGDHFKIDEAIIGSNPAKERVARVVERSKKIFIKIIWRTLARASQGPQVA
jgi:hypothetical protein